MAPPKREASETAPEDPEQADPTNLSPASARATRAALKRNLPNAPLQVKTRSASRRGSGQTHTSSEGNAHSQSRPVSRNDSVARVGGNDLDANRATKRSRVSSEQDTSQTVDQALSPDGLEDGTLFPGDRVDSRDAVNEVFVDATREKPATVASEKIQISTENAASQDEADGNTADLEGGEPKGKRPKGWHLRAENRHLLKKGSQASSKPTAKVDSLEQSKADRGDGSNAGKRLPGRKRAPHNDPKVEAALRRELDLKTAYRGTVKSLKPALDELAKRTEQDLLKDERHHEDFPECEKIQKVLDKYLQDRLDAINEEHKLRKEFVDSSYLTNVGVRKADCSQAIEDLKDNFATDLKYRFLCLAKDCEKEIDPDATDDEDGIVPTHYGTLNDEGIRKPIPPEAQSRSLFCVEVNRQYDKFNTRFNFRKTQGATEASSLAQHPEGFAVYDGQQRERATGDFNLSRLVGAGTEIEKRAEEDKHAEAEAAKHPNSGLDLLAAMAGQASRLPTEDGHPPAKSTRRSKRKAADEEASQADCLESPRTTKSRRVETQTSDNAGAPQDNDSEEGAYEPPEPTPLSERPLPGRADSEASAIPRGSAKTYSPSGKHTEGGSAHERPQLGESSKHGSAAPIWDPIGRSKQKRRPGPRAVFTSNALTGTKTAPNFHAPVWNPTGGTGSSPSDSSNRYTAAGPGNDDDGLSRPMTATVPYGETSPGGYPQSQVPYPQPGFRSGHESYHFPTASGGHQYPPLPPTGDYHPPVHHSPPYNAIPTHGPHYPPPGVDPPRFYPSSRRTSEPYPYEDRRQEHGESHSNPAYSHYGGPPLAPAPPSSQYTSEQGHRSGQSSLRPHENPGAAVPFSPSPNAHPRYSSEHAQHYNHHTNPHLNPDAHAQNRAIASRQDHPQQTMQGHPGQNMGQHLLPSTMDPSRHQQGRQQKESLHQPHHHRNPSASSQPYSGAAVPSPYRQEYTRPPAHTQQLPLLPPPTSHLPPPSPYSTWHQPPRYSYDGRAAIGPPPPPGQLPPYHYPPNAPPYQGHYGYYSGPAPPLPPPPPPPPPQQQLPHPPPPPPPPGHYAASLYPPHPVRDAERRSMPSYPPQSDQQGRRGPRR
ncbi:MAG: hypothetical protein M1831_001914 [Alyxoria varia]|nr:MAG: hypothetical protein M1831_001914 [Alyxoria varia]